MPDRFCPKSAPTINALSLMILNQTQMDFNRILILGTKLQSRFFEKLLETNQEKLLVLSEQGYKALMIFVVLALTVLKFSRVRSKYWQRLNANI